MNQRADVYVHIDTADGSTRKAPRDRSGPDARECLERISALEQQMVWVLEDLSRCSARLDMVYKGTLAAGLLPPGGAQGARLRKPSNTAAQRLGALKRKAPKRPKVVADAAG